MAPAPYNLRGVRILACPPEGQKLQSEGDALELITDAGQQGAGLVVIPVERLAEDFFQLRTGIAGALLQKFATSRLRVAIIGDISWHLAQSRALRDFVMEANRGTDVWFLANLEELSDRLG